MACCAGGPPRLPTFNLSCKIWFGATFAPPAAPHNLVVACQLVPGDFERTIGPVPWMYLKVPAGTNIHYQRAFPLNGQDLVEVPAGTGRWYNVVFVDDVGRGFPNQYRFAHIQVVQPVADPLP